MELKREVLVLTWEPGLSLGVALCWHFNLETPKPRFKNHMLLSCRMKFLAEHFSSFWVSTQCVVSSKTISASERQKIEIDRNWCFTITSKNWKVTGWQLHKKRTPMWSKEHFYLSVTACFKTSPWKKGKLKLPLIFSGDHFSINLHLQGSVTRVFSLFACVCFFLAVLPGIPHLNPAGAACTPTLTEGIPAVRHGAWSLWGGRNISVMVSAYLDETSHFFLLYLFLIWLFQTH